jgi:beta-glucosidase
MPIISRYLDPAFPFEERVTDLISRMTIQEKMSQMQNDWQAIPRLGIPAYNFWSEGLHGVAGNGRATVFPQAIGLAATWDRELVERVAAAIGDEGRAKYHAALKRYGCTGQMQGLTFWSPNINIFRDPRWGRGQETYGEDPYLSGEMGVAFVRGLQGNDPKYLKVAACAKHFAVHSGPEKDRHILNAYISLRELNDNYLPAFKRLIQNAQVEAVMDAYNRVNGEPACASPFLLAETLRTKWQFKGHVVSDCGALTDIYLHHKVAKDAAEAAAMALKAGCDLSCGCTYQNLGEALERSLIDESDIDRALARTFLTRFKLGMFDPPELVPFTSITESVISSRKHRRLAHEAALKSIVLFKNKKNRLPISRDVRRLVVTGPNASNLESLLGNYNSYNDMLCTFLEGIIARAPEGVRVTYRLGVPLQQFPLSPDWTSTEASDADVTIACTGYSPLIENEEGDAILSSENGDRSKISLPEAQVEFVRKLAGSGAKIILVLCGGGPIALGELENMVDAILFVWYPGQMGGQALAEVLFGDISLSGKLPITFPTSTEQLPAFDNYHMDNRTYRYSTDEPLYPFGFGLSYTCFEYKNLRLSTTHVLAGEPLSLHISIRNLGPMKADEVVQVYLSDLEASAPVPFSKLVRFQRTNVQPSRSRRLKFTTSPESMMFVDESGEPKLEPGRFRLSVGSCASVGRGQVLGAPTHQIAFFDVVSN